MPRVVITVDEDGSVKRDYYGYQGKSCLAADQQFSMVLAQFGIRLETVQFTPKPELQALPQELSASLHTDTHLSLQEE